MIYLTGKQILILILYRLGNEWKTRFENQEEINRHLARQIVLLERNIDQAKEEQKTGM